MTTSRAYFAAKVNANFPENPSRRGLPTIQGVLALFDAETGVPLALLDSIALTILRTAAATAVAARHLSAPDARTVTIVGCGAQAMAQLAAVRVVRKIERVSVFDIDAERCAAFARLASETLGIPVVAVADLSKATRASEIVITCTPSRTAFIGVSDVSAGAFVAAVGADNEYKQEIEPALLARAAVVTDSLDQCASIGDLHHAIECGAMTADDVRAELSAVVVNPTLGRRSADEIVVFDSTGVAFQDVAAAAVVFERATTAGVGLRVALDR
jgi:ornithine cyclodeaminase/alanine dehydrogenase-like protein (mu-crystallin family)